MQKRKAGPKPKAENELRRHRIGVYFTHKELAEIARRAGTTPPVEKHGERSGGDTAARKKIAAYLRQDAFNSLPPTIPQANLEVWKGLAPVLANLNQLAKRINTGFLFTNVDREIIQSLHAEIASIRNRLLP